MSLHHWLLKAGYRNPAIFALDYTLAPKQSYPFQLKECIAGYRQVVNLAQDPSKICIAGDSAGGCLILTLLLELGLQAKKQGYGRPELANLPMPQSSVLISPWVTLKTELHDLAGIDFLERETLWAYGYQYARESLNKTQASPGLCHDPNIWKAASPTRGFQVIYGDAEVFTSDIKDWVWRMESTGLEIENRQFVGDRGIHAWPVVSLFLSSTEERRMEGLRNMATFIRQRSPTGRPEGKKLV